MKAFERIAFLAVFSMLMLAAPVAARAGGIITEGKCGDKACPSGVDPRVYGFLVSVYSGVYAGGGGQTTNATATAVSSASALTAAEGGDTCVDCPNAEESYGCSAAGGSGLGLLGILLLLPALASRKRRNRGK